MKMKNENQKFTIKNLYVYEKWASMILKRTLIKNGALHISLLTTQLIRAKIWVKFFGCS